MNVIGKYCKVYPLKKFREFKDWAEKTKILKTSKQIIDGQEIELELTLSNEDYLFLQENYVVTGSIFKEQHIIFDKVTPEWIEFCNQTLKFEIR